MYSYGQTPKCPRCSKSVYAAEQVIGPGRSFYHKGCLKCTSCDKRLDSYTLLEHDQLPYCKQCHIREFGTRDLRQANLPQAQSPSSPTRPLSPAKPLSPTSQPASLDPRSDSHSWTPPIPEDSELPAPAPRAPPLHRVTLSADIDSPTHPSFSASLADDPALAADPILQPLTHMQTGSRYGAALGGRMPLNLNATRSQSPVRTHTTGSAARPMSPTKAFGLPRSPLSPTREGGFGAQMTGNAVKANPTGRGRWTPSSNPQCPRCKKDVYFAEQVRAASRTYHKGCLRCFSCSTSLDSSKIRDHNGEVVCMICYSKLHGPAGRGYALLGKAGG
ncbi:hypothetical protein K525DRAFT_197617 [Schizophyllum commune Loenen D]|nr:hypothetical protein K525DRAFT_197617 [Schizophyllum commune Loenen D]